MLTAKTNEQYGAFQKEIEFCQKEIRKLEDRILELMAESEPLEKNVKAAEVALKEEKAQVDAEKGLARERTAVDQKAASELQTERASIAKRLLPRPTHSTNECARDARIALAEGDGRCTCHMVLRPPPRRETHRIDSFLRELPAHSLLQSTAGIRRSGRHAGCGRYGFAGRLASAESVSHTHAVLRHPIGSELKEVVDPMKVELGTHVDVRRYEEAHAGARVELEVIGTLQVAAGVGTTGEGIEIPLVVIELQVAPGRLALRPHALRAPGGRALKS